MTGVAVVLAGTGRSLSVSVSPTEALGAGPEDRVQTNPVSVTPSSGAYSYVWTRVSGGTAAEKVYADGDFMAWDAALSPGADTLELWRVTVYSGGSPIGQADVSVYIQRL